MNIALLLSGGKGVRMGSKIPKQFIKVNDCPIIVHTMLKLQNHPEIDLIQAVCIEGWENILFDWAKKYNITKLKGIVTGGNTRFDSTRIGIESLKNLNDDDVIIVHDSVRPLVTNESISSVIKICKTFGNSMSVLNCNDTMYEKTMADHTLKEINREKIVRGQTPEAFSAKRMREAYAAANVKNIRLDSISALQIALGFKVYFAKGSKFNIKITNPEDIALFKALLTIER